MEDNQEKKREYVTNKELQLELKSMRSDFTGSIDVLRRDYKIWLIGAVALNNFLAGVQVPSVVTGSIVLGVVAKGAIAWFARM